jgi:hypothetical protein
MQKILLVVSLLFFSSYSKAQNNTKFTLSGIVKTKKSGETIISASIKVLGTTIGTNSNEYGFYSLTLNKGNYAIEFSAVGKSPDTLNVVLDKDVVQNIMLKEETKMLSDVVVKSTRGGRTISGTQMGIEKLTMKEIYSIPVLFGERDVLKTIQLLPGIKSAGEGNSGFFVRGGTSDQNQILLDEANVYNASHLLGFFSTFNSDAIKDVTIYKGGMPAQYGGRLSSVLDVKMNDGNNQDFSVSGGIGLISTKLNIEGPIQKNKSSFLVSGRRTYADAFLALSKDTAIKNNILYFYDFNAKLNYEINEKNKLFLSGYFGKDNLGFSGQFGINWGNGTGTLRWNHIFNKRLFLNTSLIFSNYNYEVSIASGENNFRIFSQIQDWNLKQDYQYNINNRNTLKFGWSAIHHKVRPGEIRSSANSSVNSSEQPRKESLENGIYASNAWKVNDKFSITYGTRLTAFSVLGGSEYYNLDKEGNVLDTMKIGRGKILNTYWNLEPRLSFGYQFNNTASVKAAYVRNVQNMHLISNSTSASPTDKWISSSNNIKPQTSDQISVGYYKNLWNNGYELTIESYYKSMNNIIDYRDGVDIFTNRSIETQLLYGKGRAYGIELMLKKKIGKLSGWISYTLSRTERQIEGINNGNWYNARQDRTHDIAIVGIYKPNEKWTFSGTWIFYTGDAVTFPNGKYTVGGQTTYYYTNRNGYRMPNYHRLDLAATMQLKKTSKWSKELSFSLYNAYGRENAFAIQFRDNENNPNVTEAVQTTLFRWVPSISYNFKF